MMKRCLVLLIAICLVAVVFTGCTSSPDQLYENAVVTRGGLTVSISVSGNLEMPHKTDLSFGTTGMVQEITVEEGDKVSKGQVLAKLDAQSLELNLKMAEARYETAKIGYEIAKNQLMQTIFPHYTNTYATDLAGAWLALDEAQNSLEEAQRLIDNRKIEEGKDSLELAAFYLHKVEEKSQARVWAVPFSVKLMELQVEQAKVSLNIASLELEKAKLELEKSIIVAPFDGIAAVIEISEGQQLSSMTYANPAISLIDPSEIEMNGVIDEIDISMVKLGQEANIILDSLPDKEIKGKVTFISQIGTVKSGVVSYKTTITLKNPDEELRDGMSATADVILEHRDDVLLVPNRAIQGSLDNAWVEVLTDSETTQRQITLGLSDGVNTEVLSGLEEDERVVLPAVSQLPFMQFGG